MSSNIASAASSKEENNNELEETYLIDDLDENCDMEKLKEINTKCVDLIFEEKPQKSIDILKKIETFLENKIIDIKININKKLLIIILHNIACCYQKLKDNDNCITYLEAVIYHFDKLIEEKHNIKINEEYFDNLIKTQNYKYDKELLGDLILELRFCAKFHLQMGVILSESKKHVDSLKHIKLAALICEDNLIKTAYLYNQLKDILLSNEENINYENNEIISIKQQIKQNYKIIMELSRRILTLRNNNGGYKKNINNYKEKKSKKNMKSLYNNNYLYIKNVITKIVKNSNKNKLDFQFNNFDSYFNYRKSEIDNYKQNYITLNDVKTSFENNFNKKDDWIKLLNIENIIYLSALNYDDLDLEGDQKYELLRDSILEKVIMLGVSYFCLSNELRYLSKDKNKKSLNGEYYLYNALNFSILFLPVSCPIIRHFMKTYYKNYGQGMDIIPEGEIIDYRIDIIKKVIDTNANEENDFNNNKYNNNLENNSSKKDKFIDYFYFTRAQKINRIIKEEDNNYYTINNDIDGIKSKSNEKKIFPKDYFNNNYYTTKKRSSNALPKSIDEKSKANNLIHSANIKLNNKDLEIFNMSSDNNILRKKNIIQKDLNQKYDQENTKISNSQTSSNISLYSENEDNNYITSINENYTLTTTNNNFEERINKSKISDNIAPKFKLNFHKINLNNNIYDSINFNNKNETIHLPDQSNTEKKRQKSKDIKKEINSDIKGNISNINITNKYTSKTSINIQLNQNYKTNTNTNINININNIDKKANSSHPIKNFNKINIKNIGFQTDRPHLRGANTSNNQKKISSYKNKKSKNVKRLICSKTKDNSVYSLYNENINNKISNILKYFNIKCSNIIEKEYLTDRLIVKINNKLKEKKIKKKKISNSNSPFCRREGNNEIYKNYVTKKKKERNPIKLIQNNTKEETTITYSILSENQKNNLSIGNNNSNIRNFNSNDSIEELPFTKRKIYRLKGDYQRTEQVNTISNRSEMDIINKYLKNINLLKKLINNNNIKFRYKSHSNDKACNKEININNQGRLYYAIKRMKIANNNSVKVCSSNIKKQKNNKI